MNLLIPDFGNQQTLEQLSSYAIGVVLVVSILMAGCHRLETMVRLFAVQSLGLIVVLLFAGLISRNTGTITFCGITFLAKCILIPTILMFVLQNIHIDRQIETYIGLPTSMLIACILTALIFQTIPKFGVEKEIHVLSSGLLSTSISMIVIGLFIMMTRKKAFVQILGLYVMENGIFALTIDTIFEMPHVVEMGIFLDLLIGAIVMGVWVYRIRQSFETINVEEMKELKG